MTKGLELGFRLLLIGNSLHLDVPVAPLRSTMDKYVARPSGA